MTDYLSELQKIEKKSQEATINKAKLEQKLTTLQDEHKKVLAELAILEVTEESLSSTISNLTVDIENALDEANEAL